MAYIQTQTMFFMVGGGFPAEETDEDDPLAIHCGGEYPFLRPSDPVRFQEWREAGMPHEPEELRKYGWVPEGKAT